MVSVSNSRFRCRCRPVLQSLVGRRHSPKTWVVYLLGREQNLSYFYPGGTPIYKLYGYVPLGRVWFSGSLVQDRVQKSDTFGLFSKTLARVLNNLI